MHFLYKSSLDKPIVAVEPSSSLDVSPGEQLTVGCRVLKSNPRVILQYEWLVLGEEDVVGTESHFTINRVSVNDNKTLQCRARNSVGTSEPASVRINVLCKSSKIKCHIAAMCNLLMLHSQKIQLCLYVLVEKKNDFCSGSRPSGFHQIALL